MSGEGALSSLAVPHQASHICPLVFLMAACLPRGVQTEVGAGPGRGQWPAGDVGVSALTPILVCVSGADRPRFQGSLGSVGPGGAHCPACDGQQSSWQEPQTARDGLHIISLVSSPNPVEGAQWPISQVEKPRPTFKGVVEAARGPPCAAEKAGSPGTGPGKTSSPAPHLSPCSPHDASALGGFRTDPFYR